uniref:Uncharacterized protein n=1 Tax=Globisporangium ultimum (strain ATCC 200006 / CBS 805.95 / DAOM BR144) TaxID=431595 RepID=K3WJ07_GLOUD
MMKQLTRGLRKYSVTSVADMSASGDQHKEEDEDAGASMLHKDFWLEALDDQHRYGFHLRAFHRAWKDDMARRVPAAADASFFHWLDHGRGRYVELPDCSQHALRSTHVQYCDEQTRRQYEVRFVSRPPPRSSQGDESVALEPVVLAEYVATGKLVHTDDLSKWIFVIDLEHKMYLARKRKGVFHHSSFVAGAPIFAAGKIMIQQGQIIAIEPHSGHFKPTLKNLTALVRTLRNQHVDLDLIAFIRPKKWSCAWPFLPSHLSELEDLASDTDYCYKSDSDETDGAPNGLGRR